MADKDDAVLRTIACLESLSEAFATYDRALFYYDPSFAKEKPVNTGLTYLQFLSQLPKQPALDADKADQDKYHDALLEGSYDLGLAVVTVYTQAISALSLRHDMVAKDHTKWLNKRLARWGGLAADRKPLNASAITEEHITRCRALASQLNTAFFEAEVWCPYTIEFKTLKNMCELVMDEIDFLSRRISELQQRRNQRVGMILTVLGLSLGLHGATAGWFSSKDEDQKAYNQKLLAAVERLEAKPVPPAPSEKPVLSKPLTITFKIPEPKPTPQQQP